LDIGVQCLQTLYKGNENISKSGDFDSETARL
jgi:hypothetical protein